MRKISGEKKKQKKIKQQEGSNWRYKNYCKIKKRKTLLNTPISKTKVLHEVQAKAEAGT